MSITANWTRENLAWAAGLFEGEGCIRDYQLVINMTDADVLKKFHFIVGFGSFLGPINRNVPAYWKPMYRWTGSGAGRVYPFLAAIWQFLGDRRRTRAEESIKKCLIKRFNRGSGSSHCINGHLMDEMNMRISSGKRYCRTCAKAHQIKHKKKKKNGSCNLQ